MGASLVVMLSIFCGTPSSQILKRCLISGGSPIGRPSFCTTRASTVTTGTSTCSEYCGFSAGALGLGGGGASSCGVFLGTAMGPTSPVGPPASGGTWSCFWSDGVCDWLAWLLELEDWARPGMLHSKTTATKTTVAVPSVSGTTARKSCRLGCLSEYIRLPLRPRCLLV